MSVVLFAFIIFLLSIKFSKELLFTRVFKDSTLFSKKKYGVCYSNFLNCNYLKYLFFIY